MDAIDCGNPPSQSPLQRAKEGRSQYRKHRTNPQTKKYPRELMRNQIVDLMLLSCRTDGVEDTGILQCPGKERECLKILVVVLRSRDHEDRRHRCDVAR